MLITRRRIADQLRKRRTQEHVNVHRVGEDPRTSTVERIPDPNSEDLDQLWDREWRQHLTDAAIRRVKQQVEPEEFQMFDLHVRREIPVKEVARKLGVTGAKVYFVKYKVARLMKKEIERIRRR